MKLDLARLLVSRAWSASHLQVGEVGAQAAVPPAAKPNVRKGTLLVLLSGRQVAVGLILIRLSEYAWHAVRVRDRCGGNVALHSGCLSATSSSVSPQW